MLGCVRNRRWNRRIGTSSELGQLFAFDVSACAAGSCAPLWTARVNVLNSSPTVSHGVVYVGSYEGDLFAFAAHGCGQATCKPIWKGTTSGQVLVAPAVAKGVVYVADSDGTFNAFDAKACAGAGRSEVVRTCTAAWTAALSAPVYDASPVVRGRRVYVASFAAAPDSHVSAFRAAGCGAPVCEPLWESTGGAYFDSSPALAYGTLYLGDGHGWLLAYGAKGCGEPTCPPLWQARGNGPMVAIASPPMVANGVVYVGENNSRIYAFDALGCGEFTCPELWDFITQDPVVDSSSVLVNGTLYVSGTNFGRVPELYVFELP